jgi:hypothetical protein
LQEKISLKVLILDFTYSPIQVIAMTYKYLLFVFTIFVWSSFSNAPRQTQTKQKDMKELLHEMFLGEDPDLNFSRNDLYVIQLEDKIAKGDTNAKFELGIQLVIAGREKEGMETLCNFVINNMGNDTIINAPESASIIHWLALAHFRLGEVTNCQENHNQSSCIIPFDRQAEHVKPLGSIGAMRLYAKLLEFNPNDPVAKWIYNLAAMTLGRYPNDVPAAWLIDFEKFRDTVATFPIFKDVAQGLGIDKPSHYGGAIIEDFNNDGLLDLFDTNSPLNEDVGLHIRQPNGTFKNTTETAGLKGITGGANAMQTDFNNDGWADVFIVRGGWLTAGGNQPTSLLRNNGDGTFTDITIKAGLLRFSPSHSAVWSDLDNDGWLDLIVGHETGSLDQFDVPNWDGKIPKHPTKVYRNNGNETFTDVTKSSGLDVVEWVKGVIALDSDKDGKQDIYLSIFNGSNRLFLNTSTAGKILFKDVSATAGIQEPKFSFPAVSADFNNDGWPDIFVAGYHVNQAEIPKEYFNEIDPIYPSYTYINQKDGTFKAEPSFMLPQSIMAMSVNAGDLDNDGFVDLYLGTGAGMFTSLFPNIMLKNVEGKRWADVTTTSRTGHLQKCHGIAMADLDRDGDLDMYVELGALFLGDFFWNALFENNLTNKANWLSLKLTGDNSNRPAIGATITITYTEQGMVKTITRTVSTGGSYGASPFEQHIGLGNAERIISVNITWPSGKHTESSKVALNKYYVWKESNTEPSERSAPKIPLSNSQPNNQEHHHHH